jgi:flagellar biosynthesis anti-sigma factor FlgM
MRVDLLPYGPERADNGKVSRTEHPASSSTEAATTGSDATRFSFDQARVQSLEAEVMAQPEIRGQKVGSLQRLLVTGQYAVSDAQIAQAMVEQWTGGSSGR